MKMKRCKKMFVENIVTRGGGSVITGDEFLDAVIYENDELFEQYDFANMLPLRYAGVRHTARTFTIDSVAHEYITELCSSEVEEIIDHSLISYFFCENVEHTFLNSIIDTLKSDCAGMDRASIKQYIVKISLGLQGAPVLRLLTTTKRW